MTSRRRAHARGASGARGLGVTAAALIGSGLLLNLLLALVARNVTTSQYALFSAFWAAALIAGFGVFLPVEQWLAGRAASGAPVPDAVGDLVPVILRVVAVECVVVAVVGVLLFGSHPGAASLVTALLVLCVLSAVQFTVRGVLIAAGRLDVFAAILVVDVLVRLAAAVLAGLSGSTAAPPYAWAVVTGIAVAHVPIAAGLRRRVGSQGAARRERPLRPVLLLMIGSLGAQVLLNGPAVTLSSLAPSSELADVGAFQAAFQLVRIPLFLVVPMQATLVPVMGRLLATRRGGRRHGLVAALLLGVSTLLALGALVGYGAGPLLVRLVFGDRYEPSAGLVALLASGAAAYLALLVLTQLLVAGGSHSAIGTSWGAGVVVAGVVYAASAGSGVGEVSATAWCFVGGCMAALSCALSVLLLLSPAGRGPELAAADD